MCSLFCAQLNVGIGTRAVAVGLQKPKTLGGVFLLDALEHTPERLVVK